MQQVPITVDSAWQMLALGRFAEALALAQQILRRAPDNVSALCCAAMAGWELGQDVHQCIATIQTALTLAPRNAAILHNLATLQASAGDSSAACATFEAALAVKPDDTRAFYGLTQNRRFTEETDVVPRMLSLYGSGLLEREELEFLCFGLAKVYADIGNRARAMHFCIEANWLAQRPFDRVGERRRVDAIRKLGEGARLPQVGADTGGPAPLFIVGMPRSGTTLVEAILSRHSSVHALGETNWMAQIEHQLTNGDPERLGGVSELQLRTCADQVGQRMRNNAADEVRVITDKTPDNAFRLHIIAALFPHARIVHVTRHPLDCALSNLFVRFSAGQGFAFRQSDLGERIRQTSAVMDIWKRSLALPILDLSYERLVADPETESRRLVAFAGLEWDPRCMTPELAPRQVQTASQFQVRQKIHQGSVGRFRGYEEWLAPLIEALGGQDWIEAEFARQTAAR